MATIATVFFHEAQEADWWDAACITFDTPPEQTITVAQPFRCTIDMPLYEDDLVGRYEHAMRTVREAALGYFDAGWRELWVDTGCFSNIESIDRYGEAFAWAVRGRALMLNTDACRRGLRDRYGVKGRLAALLPGTISWVGKLIERSALDSVVIWAALCDHRRELNELVAMGEVEARRAQKDVVTWRDALDPHQLIMGEDGDNSSGAIRSYYPWE